MSDRPPIPLNTVRTIMIEAAHRCAVCGTPWPLETAHINPWSQSHDDSPENLICLCPNCHGLADQKRWDRKTFEEYKRNPWVNRQFGNTYPQEKEPFAEGSQNPAVALNAPPSPKPFLGRKGDIQLVLALLDTAASASTPVIGIGGKIGVGKSTFLAHLAWEQTVQRRFQNGVYWAALGQSRVAESLMFREWCRLAKVDSAGLLPRDMAARLGREFLGKRILLLVDDVWQASDLGLVLGLLHSTVHLVFTSRRPCIAQELSPQRSLSLAPLDESAGLDLLRYFADAAVAAYPEKCLELVRSLEGLPLALQVAGPLLASHHKLGLGVDSFVESLSQGAALLAKDVPANMLPFLEEANQNTTVAELYNRSVDRLEPELREAFFCLGAMAPKPATFDLAAIRDLWHFLSDPVPALIMLIDSGLLEPLSNERFQMHAMLVAYAKWRLKGAEKLEDL